MDANKKLVFNEERFKLMQDMSNVYSYDSYHFLGIDNKIGCLYNPNIHTEIPVYKKINFIQRFFIKFCFGFKFIKK